MTTAVTGQGLGLILPAGTFKYGEVTRRDSERNPSVDVHSHALTKPPDTVRHDHVLSHPSTYASLDIRRRIDSVLDFAAEQTTAAVILDILRRDAQSRSTCDSVVEQLLPFLAKVFSEPVVEEVAEVLRELGVESLPETTLLDATRHIITTYCAENPPLTDAATGGSSGYSSGGQGSGGPSSGHSIQTGGGGGESAPGSGGGGGDNAPGSGGGGGNDAPGSGGAGDGNEGGPSSVELGNGQEKRQIRSAPTQLVHTVFKSPEAGSEAAPRIILRAARQFADRCKTQIPHFQIDSARTPICHLYHATRENHLPAFRVSGVLIKNTDRPNEFTMSGGFYVSNSLEHAVAHALTYQHSPSHRKIDPIVVLVFEVDAQVLLGQLSVSGERFRTKVFDVPKTGLDIGYRDKYRDYCSFVWKNWNREEATGVAEEEDGFDFVVGPICKTPGRFDVQMHENGPGGSRPLQVAARTPGARAYLDKAILKILKEDRTWEE